MGSLWNRSGMIERQDDDIRAAGALAYFFEGLTTTALTVYADGAESSAHPNPVVADANGRWPDVFVPYIVSYDVRVTTADGVQLTYTQNIPNPDPIDLSVTIPAESQIQTGMIHGEFINSTKAGYVRLNGRTIGNAVSGATERANADTSALFTYLWNNCDNNSAPVSGGRGASAAADFAANKTLGLADMRAAVLIGLDDMGTTAFNGFPSSTVFYTGSSILAGAWCGNNAANLSIANLPAHTHTGTTSTDGSHSHGGTTGAESAHTHSGTTDAESGHTHGVGTYTVGNTDLSHTHTYDKATTGTVQSGAGAGVSTSTTSATATTSSLGSHTHALSGSSASGSAHTHTFTSGAGSSHTHTISSDGPHSHTFTTSSVGSGSGLSVVPFAHLVTWFIKL